MNMTKKFKKKVGFTSIIGFEVEVKEGQPVSTPLENELFFGKITKEKAEKMLAKQYPEKTILVDTVEYHENEYEMTYEDFMTNGTLVTPTNQTENELN